MTTILTHKDNLGPCQCLQNSDRLYSVAAQTRKLKHEEIFSSKYVFFVKIEIQIYKILGLILLE